MVHLRSQLSLKDSPSLLLHLSFIGLSTGVLSGIPHALTHSQLSPLLSLLSEYPLKWWVYLPVFHGLEHNHWQKHCFQSILFA